MSDETYYEDYSNQENDFKKKAKLWRQEQYKKQKQRLAEQRAAAKEKDKQDKQEDEFEKKKHGLSAEEQNSLNQHLTTGRKLEVIDGELPRETSDDNKRPHRKKESLRRLVK